MDFEPSASQYVADRGAALDWDNGRPSPAEDLAAQRSPVGGYPKRAFDVIGALVAILLLSPLFILIAVVIWALHRGPVMYRHRRVGVFGQPFDCLKFRTMFGDADTILARHLMNDAAAREEWAETHKLKRDPRVTRLGLVLRKSCTDELPQLCNILKGEMSFVGPRPIVEAEISKYDIDYAAYTKARPGLTGPWQVSRRDEVTYAERVRLDRQYVENWRFITDLRILAKTVLVVATARGCY